MKKVVSATLAGALAVGMVPAMALADEAAPEVVADSDLELLVLDPVDDFQAGEVTAAVDVDGVAIDELEKVEFVANGKNQLLKPTKVKPEEGKEVDVTTDDFVISYVKDLTYDGAGNITGGTNILHPENIKNVNDYAAVITGVAGDYNGAVFYVPFEIVAKSLKGLAAYEIGTVEGNVSDKAFNYTGSPIAIDSTGAGKIWFELNGKPLKAAEYGSVKAYEILPSGTANFLGAGIMPENAGKYVLEVTGAGEYAGSEVEVAFTIAPFDLSAAQVYVASSDTFVAPTAVASLTDIAPFAHKAVLNKCDGDATADGDQLVFTYKSDTTGKAVQGDPGEYTYVMSVNPNSTAAAAKNFTGSKELKFVVAETVTSNLFYGKNAAPAPGAIADVDYSNDDVAYDLSKFAYLPAGLGSYDKDKVIPTKAVAYKKNAAGAWEVVSDVAAPGSYKVEVSVDSAAAKYKFYSAAPAVYTFDVTNGAVLDTDLVVTYDGAVKTAITKTYDGKDALDLIQVKVKTDGGAKVLTAGTDYNYTIVNNAEPTKPVSEIVDAGTYTLTIADGAYDMPATNNTVTITVNAIEIEGVRVADQVKVLVAEGVLNDNGTPADDSDDYYEDIYEEGLAYTGKEIVPTYEYYAQAQIDAALAVAKVKENNDGLTWASNQATVLKYMEWVELPADVVATLDAASEPATVAEPKNGKVDQLGTYTMNLSVPATVVNYTLAAGLTSVTFDVINGSVFKDVPAGKWYTEAVMDAYTLGYMNGIGGGLFDPNGAVTRGMAACILFNMAGEWAGANETVNNNGGFVTPFADVKPGMWYAEAIQWAEKAGIVNGWVEDGEKVFAPDQKITREQWAAMLANYAKVYGGFEAPAADALAGFADAEKVSGWAEESVAWAVENGIMGNGGAINPKADIIRAEAAAMAVNYQPVAL